MLPSEVWPPSRVAWLASTSLCATPHPPLHTCLPHPSSQHPFCIPLFSCHTSAFSPSLTCIVLPSLCPLVFCSLRVGVNKLFFFFARIQTENIVGFVCYTVSIVIFQLSCCRAKTGSKCGCVPIKLYSQNQVVAILGPQTVVADSLCRAWACKVVDLTEKNNFLIIRFAFCLMCIILSISEVFSR